jgi:hypothetical protein
MTLLELLSQDGHELTKIATTNGGEFAGPCPFCQGVDRFRVWPDQDRYWCRICKKSGDSIQYLRDTKGLSYPEACHALNVQPKTISWRLKPKATTAAKAAVWVPRETRIPGEVWQAQAKTFLDRAQGHLWSDQGKETRQWLNNRGLTDETIKQAGLGLNPHDLFWTRQYWGLEPVIHPKTGKPKKVWAPSGLVIPHIIDGQVIRLRIRTQIHRDGNPYIIVPGSDMGPMAWGMDKEAIVIVESELDGFLVNQEAGGVVGVVALGSAQARPDPETHEALSRADIILLALDTDQAGAKECWQWWVMHYSQVKRWPVPSGKDPGEAFQAGLNILAWVEAGLMKQDHKENNSQDNNGSMECQGQGGGSSVDTVERIAKPIIKEDESQKPTPQVIIDTVAQGFEGWLSDVEFTRRYLVLMRGYNSGTITKELVDQGLGFLLDYWNNRPIERTGH